MRKLKFVFFVLRSRTKVKARKLCNSICGVFWDFGIYIVLLFLILQTIGD